jgi:dethiobiotin synthetase
MISNGLFVTGTDTGVGKTLITCAIARLLYSSGVNVGVMKPIETGWQRDASDAVCLKRAARVLDPISQIVPYHFADPIAPWPASLREKRPIRITTLMAAYRQLQKKHSFLVVEGVGGLLVPITARMDLIHLILKMALPVLLVARSGLGTLNHTLLTLRHGEAQGIRFCGIVLNQTQPKTTLADETNRAILKKRTHIPIFGPFPHMKNWEKDDTGIERVKTVLCKMEGGLLPPH